MDRYEDGRRRATSKLRLLHKRVDYQRTVDITCSVAYEVDCELFDSISQCFLDEIPHDMRFYVYFLGIVMDGTRYRFRIAFKEPVSAPVTSSRSEVTVDVECEDEIGTVEHVRAMRVAYSQLFRVSIQL